MNDAKEWIAKIRQAPDSKVLDLWNELASVAEGDVQLLIEVHKHVGRRLVAAIAADYGVLDAGG